MKNDVVLLRICSACGLRKCQSSSSTKCVKSRLQTCLLLHVLSKADTCFDDVEMHSVASTKTLPHLVQHGLLDVHKLLTCHDLIYDPNTCGCFKSHTTREVQPSLTRFTETCLWSSDGTGLELAACLCGTETALNSFYCNMLQPTKRRGFRSIHHKAPCLNSESKPDHATSDLGTISRDADMCLSRRTRFRSLSSSKCRQHASISGPPERDNRLTVKAVAPCCPVPLLTQKSLQALFGWQGGQHAHVHPLWHGNAHWGLLLHLACI